MQIFNLLKVGNLLLQSSPMHAKDFFFSQGVQSRMFKIFLGSWEKIFDKIYYLLFFRLRIYMSWLDWVVFILSSFYLSISLSQLLYFFFLLWIQFVYNVG